MAKILLVEDDGQTADLMKFVLQRAGHEVEHITDGSLTLEKAKAGRFALIVLDIMLPGLDGYSVHSKLLEDDQTKGIPVLVSSSKHNMEEVFQTSANVVGFISKPFVVKDFVGKVQAVLKK